MQVHQALESIPAFRNAVVTIGTFDGVHKGHQQVLASMKAVAQQIGGQTVILTFHPHPRKVVGGEAEKIVLLNTLDEKIALLAAQGVDHLVVIPFTESFSQMSAEEYVGRFLVRYFHPHTIIIGYDHRYGHNREGDFRLLEALGPRFGYRVLEIPEQVIHEIKVSSTRIREAILEGNTSLARELLGYPYFFEGLVVEGKRLGRTLGFPTANLDVTDAEKLIPANGVYAVRADIPGGASLPAMMNIGFRPTVDGLNRVIEVHLLDFQGDLYGKRMRVHLAAYLRPEKRFPGLDALKQQLIRDREQTLDNLNQTA